MYELGGLDDIQQIFKLGIGGYETADDHITFDSTRLPQFYDKHLDKALRLEKVAYCPGLNPQIGEIANIYYKKYIEKFGPPPTHINTDPDLVRLKLQDEGVLKVRSERGILNNYAKIIPDIALPIVSALAFETPWSRHYLDWTTEPKQDVAIVDAALLINPDYPPPGSARHQCPYTSAQTGNTEALSCAICDHPRRKEVKDTARYFPSITLHEFKSLLSGSYEHLIALLELTRDETFDWVECHGTCSHDATDFRVTGGRTGFDSENPIIQLEAADWTETEIGRSLRTSKPLVKLLNKHGVSAKRIVQQVKLLFALYDSC